MACTAHHHDRRRTEGKVLCFECYRARLDRPERLPVFVIPFPRLLTERERDHRQRMIDHLAANDASRL